MIPMIFQVRAEQLGVALRHDPEGLACVLYALAHDCPTNLPTETAAFLNAAMEPQVIGFLRKMLDAIEGEAECQKTA